MASPLSPLVLAAGALLTAPALYESLVLGALPAEAAAARFAVAVVFISIGASLVGSLIRATSAPRHSAARSAETDPSSNGPGPLTARPVGASTDRRGD